MATRNVSLTDTLDRFVEERVASGDFQNASEVVRAALRRMKVDAERERAKLERLKGLIQVGLDELDRGEGEIIEWEELRGWLDSRGRRAVE